MNRLPRIAVTIRSFNEHGMAFKKLQECSDIVYTNCTGERLGEAGLSEVLNDVEGVIAGTEPFTKEVLQSASQLRVISRVGIGLDSIDLEQAALQKIAVYNTPDAPSRSVAEHTIALLFSIVKKIPAYNSQVHKGIFSIESGSLVLGKTIGIIGLGRIGCLVAELASAIGCRVLFFDPYLSRPVPDFWVQVDSLAELLAQSDFITLHASPQPGRKHILDKGNISKCKKGAIILNTARGNLIEELALIHSLDNGHVAAVGLDVYPYEPYNGKLLEYDNVIMTPHIASNTREARMDMEMEAVNNLLSGLKDEKS